MTTVEDCIFCNIANHKKDADIIYEDSRVVAFHDQKPAAKLHVLIVPKEHIPTLNDVPPDSDLVGHIARTAVHLAHHFGVAEPGYRVFINVNKGGSQEIFHLHCHVISKVWDGQTHEK